MKYIFKWAMFHCYVSLRSVGEFLLGWGVFFEVQCFFVQPIKVFFQDTLPETNIAPEN